LAFAREEMTMLRWLPPDEGLHTIDIEAGRTHESVRRARLAPGGPGLLARLVEAVRQRLEDRHSLTDYPCRLPDGRTGRTAIRQVGGEWVGVCVL
jgi:hypothetical protein